MENFFVEQFCEKNGFTFIEFLHQNFDKDTSVVKINNKKTKEFGVLKILGSKANDDVKNALENEIKFYQKGAYSYAPKMISCGKEYLAIEFFEGIPLREYINLKFLKDESSQKNELYLFDQLSKTLEQFYALGKGIFQGNKNDIELVSNTMFDRIGNLISSGPEFTQPSKLEQFILRQIFKLVRPDLKRNLTKIVKQWIADNVRLMSDFGHYDLHSENILVGKTCKIIDYGNFKQPGIWISDILYFYATLYASFSSQKDFQEKIIAQAFSQLTNQEPKLKNDKTLALIKVFCFATDVNSRFRIKNKGIKIPKMFSFLSSIKSLK